MKNTQTEGFISAVLSLRNREECRRFFSDILTVKELADFSQRLEVARLLRNGVNYVDIAAATGASTVTISRVSKSMATSEGGYDTVLDRIELSGETNDEVMRVTLPDDDFGRRLADVLAAGLRSLPHTDDGGEG